MGRKQEKEILKHITLDELNKIIKKEEKSVRVLERLYFIRFLYKGDKIKEACDKIDITDRLVMAGLIRGTKVDMLALCQTFGRSKA